MKEYTLKEAAEYLGLTYKQFHYAVSQGYWGLNKGDKKFAKRQLDHYMRLVLDNKIKRADTPVKEAKYKAMLIAFMMKSYAKDILNSDKLQGCHWEYMAQQFSRNAHKITTFIDAHK